MTRKPPVRHKVRAHKRRGKWVESFERGKRVSRVRTGKVVGTWKILARHRWVSGATITESMLVEDDLYRRFTATVLGWRGFRIYEGRLPYPTDLSKRIMAKVVEIRDRIGAGDESVFHEPSLIME